MLILAEAQEEMKRLSRLIDAGIEMSRSQAVTIAEALALRQMATPFVSWGWCT